MANQLMLNPLLAHHVTNPKHPLVYHKIPLHLLKLYPFVTLFFLPIAMFILATPLVEHLIILCFAYCYSITFNLIFL